MIVIAILRVGFHEVVLQSGQIARVLVERFANTVVQLISFPKGQLVQPQSGN